MTNLCQTFVTAEGYDLLLQEQKVNGFKVDCDAFEGSELAAKGGTEKQRFFWEQTQKLSDVKGQV